MLFTVHFTVTVSEQLKPEEFIFVTGNVPQLGEWRPNDAFRLSETDDGHWTGTVSIGVDTIKFRYFIGYYLEPESGKAPLLIVSKWETHLIPRCLLPAVESSKASVCRANVKDFFGFNGGREMVSDGWLMNPEQNQIILTIQGRALTFYKKKHECEKYRIKVVPMDVRHREDSQGQSLDDEDIQEEPRPTMPSYSPVQIASIAHAIRPHYRTQNPRGESFHNEHDYFIYRANSVAVKFFAFRIEVYSDERENSLIAFGHALPSSLHDTFGQTSIQMLTEKGALIGTIHFGYLFVRPLGMGVEPFKMNVSYVKHWKKRVALEVGHRGMGNSYTKFLRTVARENTLHSLNSAAQRGADYVEFDVHLTKDKIPIIFHDFHVLVSVAKRSSPDCLTAISNSKTGAVEEHELAVKDLKFSQLRLLHLDHVEHERRGSTQNAEDQLHYKITGTHDEADEHRPFPTLEGAFNYVSEETGFNIEIKFPMQWMNGQHECANYFERNEFVDIILAEVFRNAGSRRIVFSSFDPDICTILTLKQNKYPVLFLSQGKTEKHMEYVDIRTRTSEMAVLFAAGIGLTGVNLHSEDLLRDPAPIALAKQFGLITFVWGDELSDKGIASRFKNEFRCDGVIFDGIGENENRKNVFLLERAKKQELFGPPQTTGRKSPSPLQSPCHRQSSVSTVEVNNASLIDRLPILTTTLEHLDLPVTSSITVNSKMQVPLLFSSAHSSTSSGISSESGMVTTTSAIKRQHYSLNQENYAVPITHDV